MNEQLQKQLTDILRAMRGAIEQYGPEAMQLALDIRRWDAIGRLSTGFLFLLIAYFGFRYVLKLFRQELVSFEKAKKEEDNGWLLHPVLPYTILACGGTAALTLIIVGLTRVLYIWHWVALAYPEIALAHDLLLKMGLMTR